MTLVEARNCILDEGAERDHIILPDQRGSARRRPRRVFFLGVLRQKNNPRLLERRADLGGSGKSVSRRSPDIQDNTIGLPSRRGRAGLVASTLDHIPAAREHAAKQAPPVRVVIHDQQGRALAGCMTFVQDGTKLTQSRFAWE